MKDPIFKILSILICISGLISPEIVIADDQSPFQYLYPINDTRYHSVEADIILRPGYEFTESDLKLIEQTQIIGERSGLHEFQLRLVEDGNTVVLKMLAMFEYGEQVNVRFAPKLEGENGVPISDFDYKLYTVDQHPFPFTSINSNGKESVLSKDLDTIPEGFPDFNIQIAGDTYDAPLFMTPTSNIFNLIIMEDDGTPTYVNSLSPAFGWNLSVQNNLLTYFEFFGQGYYLAMDSTYTVVDTFRCQNGLITDSHEIVLKSNGNAYMISYVTNIVDMSQVVPGGNSEAAVVGAVIQEIDPSDNVVFEWRSYDHFDILDGIHNGTDTIDFTAEVISYVHMNSIDEDADGNLIISSRHMNEITKIDRSTGDIVWRLGGKNSDFTFINDYPYGFTGQHDARILDNGNVTVFDNGTFHNPSFARAVEYELDLSNMTATLTSEIVSPLGVSARIHGSYQTLPNGNKLISWGRSDFISTFLISEYDSLNNGVLSIEAGLESNFGTSYRVLKFPWETDLATNISAPEVENNPISVFPNPATKYFRLEYEKPIDKIIVRNSIGQNILINEAPGRSVSELNTTGWKAGVYFLSLITSEQQQTLKVIIH